MLDLHNLWCWISHLLLFYVFLVQMLLIPNHLHLSAFTHSCHSCLLHYVLSHWCSTLPPLVLLLSIYRFIVLLTTWFSCLLIIIANTNVAIPPEPSLKPPPHWPSTGLNNYAFCPSFFSSSTSRSTFSFFSYAFFIGQISLPYIMASLICHWPHVLWGCMNAG